MQSFATVTEVYGLWNLIMRSSYPTMYRCYHGTASIMRGVHRTGPNWYTLIACLSLNLNAMCDVRSYKIMLCSTRYRQSVQVLDQSCTESKSLISLSWQKAIRHGQRDCLPVVMNMERKTCTIMNLKKCLFILRFSVICQCWLHNYSFSSRTYLFLSSPRQKSSS